MNSRERVLRAIEHRPVDRVPIDLGMHYSTGISAFAYRDLRRYLGLPDREVEVIDPQQFLARVETDVLQRFHVDCMLLHPGFLRTMPWNPRGDYQFRIPAAMNPVQRQDGSWLASNGQPGVGLTMPARGFFFDGTGFDLFAEDDDSLLHRYALEARRIYEETDYFTIYIGFSGYHGDMDYLCDMVADPERIRALNSQICEDSIKAVGRLIDHAGHTIQGIAVGGDWGTQISPFVRPALYEDLCLPYLKRFCDFVKANSDYKIFNHSCGAVREFIPYFIEAGIDVLNPVQISAAGMEPEALKRDFGDKITFWGGGCDTQSILNFGSPDTVREHVTAMMRIFKTGSGYVFNQVHNIMGNVPPANIVAMLNAAYESSFCLE